MHFISTYCILRRCIKGTASAVFVIQYLCSLRYLLCAYTYNKLLMAWEGVLYVEYSTQDRVLRTIQHSASPRAVLFSRPRCTYGGPEGSSDFHATHAPPLHIHAHFHWTLPSYVRTSIALFHPTRADKPGNEATALPSG